MMGAGFALPRDAGRRPALQGAASRSGGGIRCGEGAARTLARRRVIGAGFALPRDAGLHRENPHDRVRPLTPPVMNEVVRHS